ncbi:MAG: DUF4013 domain-containing protein [Cyanobacteria bacterium P01_F01_bin.86]
MMNLAQPLTQALRYPWQGKDWLYRMLPLALLQLIPILGQIVLAGYGQAIVRAIYQQQRDLPRLYLRRSLVDGLQLVAVGIIYCLPVILTVLLVFGGNSTPTTENSGGIPGIVYPITLLVYRRISSEIVKRRPALKSVVSFVNRVFSILVFLFIFLRLRSLFATLGEGLQFSEIALTRMDWVVLLAASLLLTIIVAALLTSGVQFAITGRGLLNARATLKQMVANRGLTVRFTLTTWLLIVGTSIAAVMSAPFLLVPGLLLIIAGNAAIWFLATQYAIRIGMFEANE